jgi:hypothetical protein
MTDTTSLGTLIRSEANIEHLWTIAAYAPIAEYRHTLLKTAVEEATKALKLPSQISKLIESSLRNADSIRATVDLFQTQGQKTSRSIIGMAIRLWGATWKLQVLFSLLAEIVYRNSLLASSPSMSCPNDTAFTAQRRLFVLLDFSKNCNWGAFSAEKEDRWRYLSNDWNPFNAAFDDFHDSHI